MKKLIFNFFLLVAFIFPTVALGIGAYLLIKNPMFESLNGYIIGVLAILLLLVITCLIRFILKKSKKGQIIMIVLSILLGAFVTGCDVLYSNVIKTMSNITTIEGDTVTSNLYVLKDTDFKELVDLKGKNIAVQPATSLSMYTLLTEAIEEAEMNVSDFTLSQYTNYINSYEDFLDGLVDGIVLDESAISIIKEVYPEFEDQVKSVATFTKVVETQEVAKIDVSTEPFTMLISGIDARSTNLNAYSRSDVIMIAAFNPQTLKLSLTSVPRDTYLPVTCRGFSDKITHSGTGGIQCTETSLEKAFGIEIDYYVKVNFTAVVDIVDALGGIEVDVPFSFTESNSYDTPHAVTLTKGLQTIDGEQALALCRHRYTLPRGDIDRGQNQQLVLEGLLRKVASSSSVMNVDKLLGVLGSNIQTNMPVEQMYDLFSLLTNLATNSKFGDLSALSIKTHTIDGTGNMHTPSYTSLKLYFYMPYEYSIKNTTRNIKRILGKESYPLPTKTFAFNANVPYDKLSDKSIKKMDNDRGSTSYAIPDYTDYTKEWPTMGNMVGKTMSEINAWVSSIVLPDGYSISPYFVYEDGTPATDSTALCISQSIATGVEMNDSILTEGVNGITFTFQKPATEGGEITDPDNPDSGTTNPDNPGDGTTPPENPDSGTTDPENPEGGNTNPDTGTIPDNPDTGNTDTGSTDTGSTDTGSADSGSTTNVGNTTDEGTE